MSEIGSGITNFGLKETQMTFFNFLLLVWKDGRKRINSGRDPYTFLCEGKSGSLLRMTETVDIWEVDGVFFCSADIHTISIGADIVEVELDRAEVWR